MKRVVFMLLLVAGSAAAQAPHTIAPGMSRAEVVARLGQPLATRTLDGSTYLYYANGCERRCGMQDLVVLDSDRVVDAIFRSPDRRYAGVSSSPEAVPAADAVRQAGTAREQGITIVPKPAAHADSGARSAAPAPPTPPKPDIHIPVGHQPTSTSAPTRSEIRIPRIGTPGHAAPATPTDTLHQPVQPARRQGD